MVLCRFESFLAGETIENNGARSGSPLKDPVVLPTKMVKGRSTGVSIVDMNFVQQFIKYLLIPGKDNGMWRVDSVSQPTPYSEQTIFVDKWGQGIES